MAAFDQYAQELEKRASQQEQQNVGAAATLVGGVTHVIKDRWWKKEFEEFKESAGAEFNEALTKLGQLTSDETFEDVSGAWSIFSSSIKNYMEKVGEYPQNPYIANLGKNMFNLTQNMYKDFTQGLTAQQEVRASRAEQERLTAREPLVRERYKAETEESRAAAAKSRAGAGIGLTKGKLTYGDASLYARTPVALHLETIRKSKTYRDQVKESVRGVAATEWQNLADEDRAEYAFKFDNYLQEHPGLNFEQQKEIDRSALGLHLGQFYGGQMGPYEIGAIVNQILGPKEQEIKNKVADIKAQKIPAGAQIIQESPASQTVTFATDEDIPPEKNLYEDPPPPIELEEKYAGSPAHILVGEYWRRRDEGALHQDAIEDLFRNPEHGGSGIVDGLVADRFEMLPGPEEMTTEKSIENWRRDLLKLLSNYEDYYEDYLFRKKEKELQKEMFVEGTMSKAGLELLGRRTGRGIKGILESIGTDLVPAEEALAEEGLRPGGKILPPKPRRLPKGVPHTF
jgi:hypothetical protein